MKELSDKDFDQIFKSKIKEGYPEYEEGSWLKMEEKLRKRDRFVFFRNASIILLFLSLGIGLYLISGEKLVTGEVKAVKKIEGVKSIEMAKGIEDKKTIEPQNNSEDVIGNNSKTTFAPSKVEKRNILSSRNNIFTVKKEIISKSPVPVINEAKAIDSVKRIAQNQVVVSQNAPVVIAQESTNPTSPEVLIDAKPNVTRKTNKLPITLSIHVGPDFSSTESAIGGKSGATVGVGVHVGLTKKLGLETGLNYGSKNYKAKGYDYTFNNPNTVNTIAGIDAACKVLEIPLRASYTLMDNQKNSIDFNAGLSSYLMLKENYRFIYTAASGRKDRFLEKENSNQHYLSVIDLSATYNIKLKNKKFALGIQPYVKIPITGIGEGNVPLKSSGISLKLNYELNKKK